MSESTAPASSEITNGQAMRSAKAWRACAKKTTMLELPSGFSVEVCRPSLAAWFQSGRLPQPLVGMLMKAARGESSPGNILSDLGDDDFLEALKFMRDIVTATVVHPRIVAVADPESETEIGVDEIPEADFNALVRYAMSGSAGVAVQMEEGETTTLDSLGSFREDKRLFEPQQNVPDVRGTSGEPDGNSG